jgi:protocatechuate 3,4-dioxygenase beta subunit
VADDEDIGPVVGRVHDEANRPIPDICISAVDPRTGRTETLARTDAEGRYRAEGLRADTITLRMCDPEDHDFGWLAATMGPGIDVANGREANGDMQLVSLGALRGRVVDLAGHPVAGACVAPWLQPWARAVTDAEGRFTARHVIVGHYFDDFDSAHLYASCSGGRQLTMRFGDFYVNPGEWTEIVITTDPDGPSPPPPGPGCCVGSGPTI